MIARIALLMLTSLFLAGCGHTFSGSVAGGESKVFEPPPYVVKGKTRYDQDWVDSQIEGGVAAFGWKRPAPRPPELDAAPTRARKIVPAKAKKKSLIRQVMDHMRQSKRPIGSEPAAKTSDRWPDVGAPVPVMPPPEPQPVEPPASPPAPPPPREPVDELLSPSR